MKYTARPDKTKQPFDHIRQEGQRICWRDETTKQNTGLIKRLHLPNFAVLFRCCWWCFLSAKGNRENVWWKKYKLNSVSIKNGCLPIKSQPQLQNMLYEMWNHGNLWCNVMCHEFWSSLATCPIIQVCFSTMNITHGGYNIMVHFCQHSI